MDEELAPTAPEADAPATENPMRPKRVPDEVEKKLVTKKIGIIKADRKHHEKAYKQMREDMYVARVGAPKDWPSTFYVANIAGRHVNQKTAALYAKNPKAIARRRERLDFTIWDENEQTLMQALQIVMQAAAAPLDPMTGQAVPAPMNPMMAQAMALVQDYEQGMQRRQQVEKIGKTLELLFDYYTKEQTPVDFKTSMKQLVRRATTCGVGYLELGFQREMDEDPQVTQRISDFTAQLRRLEHMAAEVDESDADEDKEVERREIELTLKSLQEQQYVLVREGLIFDFPDSTSVIPDKMCRNLTGFVGARWVTIQYLYTTEEVEQMFNVELGKNYRAYSEAGEIVNEDQGSLNLDDGEARKGDLVCVWKHYDKQAGLVYLLCDGYEGFLRDPAAPDVYVDDFWPLYALTFNEVEDPACLFPPSDVRLMWSMVLEYLRARQGQAEHRKAARPRFVTFDGMLDDDAKKALGEADAFSVTELQSTPDNDIGKILQAVQVPGVDPNLYETNQFMTDIQLTVGAQEAQFGAVAKATATESSIAEGSRIASVDSNVDDLDAFLTRVARASGQVLLRDPAAEAARVQAEANAKAVAGENKAKADTRLLGDLVAELGLQSTMIAPMTRGTQFQGL